MTYDIACARVLCDVFMQCLAWLPLVVFHFGVRPAHRGFFCDDQSIRYPFIPHETVNNPLLYCLVFLPPIGLILMVEAYRVFYDERRLRGRSVPPAHRIGGRPVPAYVSRSYFYIGYFMLGLAFVMAFTEIGKYTIGRLRPHFLSVCQPKGWINMTCPFDPNFYVTDEIECTGDPHQVKEARISFPSGHSSSAAYAMIYVVMYLEARGFSWGSRALRPVIQLLFLALAVYTALTRVADYWHHPGDVLAGSLLGSTVALIIGFRVIPFQPFKFDWLKSDWDPNKDEIVATAVGMAAAETDLEQQLRGQVNKSDSDHHHHIDHEFSAKTRSPV